MSDKTARELERCRAIETQAHDRVAEAKRDLASKLEREIRPRLIDHAKSVTLSQPHIARKLGAQGIASLRTNLSAALDDVLVRMRATIQRPEWPPRTNAIGATYHGPSAGAVRDGISDFLHGEIGNFNVVLTQRGFSVELMGGPLRLYPNELFDSADEFTDLVDALLFLDNAKKNTAAAQAADDHDFVSSLWDE
ncbi:hypothetical protein [Mycolicibacterium fortuitum]|uniref:hypothetical protein n=1 Tax=Mycolicibacterium fortuitum TaxID=1766 RepID=UPI000B018BA4|nr:hypothetical protein [Mycolicibacterium fortuitum]